jgi:hypothetical protein
MRVFARNCQDPPAKYPLQLGWRRGQSPAA